MRSEKPKILVVDDNSLNLQLVASTLAENGYEPVVTASGVQALDFLQKETSELILLDVMMPKMDGFEVCRRIKSNDKLKALPVIFLTVKTEIEDLLRGFELGAVDYICKPFNVLELLARIKLHLELKWAREEIKTLRDILPICSFCKKIRDDKGYWTKVEEYIIRHTDMQFSHGICLECAKEHYPEFCDELDGQADK